MEGVGKQTQGRYERKETLGQREEVYKRAGDVLRKGGKEK